MHPVVRYSTSLPFLVAASRSFSLAAAFAPMKTAAKIDERYAHAVAPLRLGAGLDADVLASSASMVAVADGDLYEAGKVGIMALAFGGGMIPAAIVANRSMVRTLTNQRPEKPDLTDEQKRRYLDPTYGAADYIENSGAAGPALPGAALLLPPERIPLADIVAVVGRLDGVGSVADWADLPSTRQPKVRASNPPMWLPRATFKANIRKARFLGWPDDASGRPVGGEELRSAEERRISKSGALIGDAALDAVFDTWAGGAAVATPDKVEKQLRSWRPDSAKFSLTKFTSAAVSGRSLVAIAALTFIAVQALAYGTLFVAPTLRVFFNVDIGLGEMGTCDPALCTHLF